MNRKEIKINLALKMITSTLNEDNDLPFQKAYKVRSMVILLNIYDDKQIREE